MNSQRDWLFVPNFHIRLAIKKMRQILMGYMNSQDELHLVEIIYYRIIYPMLGHMIKEFA